MGIAAKLNLLTVSIILLTAVAIGIAVVRTQANVTRASLESHGVVVTSMLARGAEFPLFSDNRETLELLLAGLAADGDVSYAAFYGAQRQLIVDRPFSAPAERSIPAGAFPEGADTLRLTRSGSRLDFVAAVRRQADARDAGAVPIGYVRVSLALGRANRELVAFVNETARFAIVVTALAIVLTLLFTRRLVQPVRELASTAREVANGHLGQTVSIRTNDELADLGRAFQQMIDSLGASRARLLEYQNLLEDRVQARTRELEHATAQAVDLAQRDTLTKLPNRAHFHRILEQAMSDRQQSGERIALLFLDLDLFKRINDTLGHQAGDQLLCHIADTLRGCVRGDDLVARLGGDEFVILSRDIRSTEQVTGIARRVLNAFSSPVDVDGHAFRIGFSIGISLAPEHGTDAQTLLRNADLAMYATKEQGRGNYRFFTPDLNQRAMDRLNIESGLRRALDSNTELFLEYQPQVALAGGKLIAAEALLRWRQPDGSVMPPARFIPVAEETGLIIPIGERVLQAACAALRRWREAGLPLPRIAVNVAAPQFESRQFCQTVARALEESGVPPDRLELELTESVIVRDADSALREMQRLKELGVSIALDDFGTGYSSLSYLSRLPVDVVKIDRAFVMRSTEDRNAHTIVRSIIALSHSLGHKVVAEGVETRAQVAVLRAAGCDLLQGYLLARPMSEDALSAWLSSPLTPAEAALGDGGAGL